MSTYKNLYYNSHNFLSAYACGEDNGAKVLMQSESAFLYGISFLFGNQKHISKYMMYEFYFAPGISFKTRKYSVTESYTCKGYPIQNPSTYHYSEDKFLIAIPIGIKLSYIINAKK